MADGARGEGPSYDDLVDAARALGETLAAESLSLATAESCTGGLVGEAVTAVPGSSRYYLGGVVSYADAAKVRLLGVAETSIRAHGAVSEATAIAMATGVRGALGADIGVSVTGIAGPTGGSPGKPVGLVYVGLATAVGEEVRALHLAGDRAAIRRGAAAEALRLAEHGAATMADAEAPRAVAGEPRPPPESVPPSVAGLEAVMSPAEAASDAELSVQAVFQPAGEITPVAFRWHGHDHRVAQVGGMRDEAGRRVFTVMTPEARMFELVLELEDLAWSVQPVGPVPA